MHHEGFGQLEVVTRVRRWFDLPAEKNLLLVADHSGDLVGYGRAALVAKPQQAGFEHVPAGWYLTGVIVDERFRRRGIGELLTRERLTWILRRSDEAYFFANSLNIASIELHRRLGFEEVVRDFSFPGVTFVGKGVGILYRALGPLTGPR
jgi:ribosomal protein S18 acetylase RimI-like enzyme